MNFSKKNYTEQKDKSIPLSKKFTPLLLIAFVLVTMGVDAQTTRYVDSTGSDTGNCTDPSNACATINYAMGMAGSGDVINIAAGVYTEQLSIQKDLTFQGAGSTQPGGTILQAHAIPGQATGGVITIDGTYSIQISGLTIRHGVSFNGGGLHNIDSNLTLTDVTFTENTADYGGGMYNDSGILTLNDVNFINNVSVVSGGGLNNYTPNEVIVLNGVAFSGNIAGNAAGGVALYGGDAVFTNVVFDNNIAENSDGGGVYVSTTNATFTDISFTDNEAQGGGQGGAVYIEESTVDFTNATFIGNKIEINYGGAVYTDNSTVSFANTTFTGNEAAQLGGGLLAFNSEITLLEVLFEENIAEMGGAIMIGSNNNNNALIKNTYFKNNEATGDYGGGLINEGSITTLVNTLFTGNKSSQAGGAITNAGVLHLLNNTITQNEGTTVGAGGLYHLMGSLTMTNSIVWGNIGAEAPDIAIANGAVLTGNYSLYDDSDVFNEGIFNCDDCLTINPQFADAAGGDFTLSGNSPALDAGDPNTDLTLFPTDGDNSPIDLDGNARVFNNTIDMGAYEYSVLSTGVFNNTALHIAMYPNPVKDILHLETEENIESIIIYTIMGQQLQTWKNENSIDVSTFTAGIYLVKVTTQNSSSVKQIIKQ